MVLTVHYYYSFFKIILGAHYFQITHAREKENKNYPKYSSVISFLQLKLKVECGTPWNMLLVFCYQKIVISFHPWNNISLIVLNSQNYTNEINVWETQWISQVKKNHKSILCKHFSFLQSSYWKKVLNNNTVSHGGYPSDLDQT